jgi:putative FmdB family regulatory protein
VPRYDYQCTECNHRFELKQGFDAETVTDCPECGKIAERQISLVPVIFKGSGWYVNDYGKKKSTIGDSSSSNGSDGGGDSAGSSNGGGANHEDSGHGHSHGGHSHTHDHSPAAAPATDSSSSSDS